jgi:hypothetical protein
MLLWRRVGGGDSGRALLRSGPSERGSARWFAAFMSWAVGAMGALWLVAGVVGLVVKALGS